MSRDWWERRVKEGAPQTISGLVQGPYGRYILDFLGMHFSTIAESELDRIHIAVLQIDPYVCVKHPLYRHRGSGRWRACYTSISGVDASLMDYISVWECFWADIASTVHENLRIVWLQLSQIWERQLSFPTLTMHSLVTIFTPRQSVVLKKIHPWFMATLPLRARGLVFTSTPCLLAGLGNNNCLGHIIPFFFNFRELCLGRTRAGRTGTCFCTQDRRTLVNFFREARHHWAAWTPCQSQWLFKWHWIPIQPMQSRSFSHHVATLAV